MCKIICIGQKFLVPLQQKKDGYDVTSETMT